MRRVLYSPLAQNVAAVRQYSVTGVSSPKADCRRSTSTCDFYFHERQSLTSNTTQPRSAVAMASNDTEGAQKRVNDHQAAGYNAYHCLCSELVVAIPDAVDALPKRQQDGAFICELEGREPTTLVGTTVDVDAMILKLEDGFEKRYPLRCSRCGLMVGYHLDQSQYEQSREASGPFQGAVYFLPEGLLTTEDMMAGKQTGK